MARTDAAATVACRMVIGETDVVIAGPEVKLIATGSGLQSASGQGS
jgi:hypothetical protein